MEDFNRAKHWDTIYKTKALTEVSWYQPTPQTALRFIKELNLPKESSVLDIGGGDSLLVDNLLDMGFSDLTVLDISEAAIKRAQKRLGENSKYVKWIVSDIVEFKPTMNYDLWYDRATFHFLTKQQEVSTYVKTASESLGNKGKMIIGTFSEQGPETCSGIQIKQYSEKTLPEVFAPYFKKLECSCLDHKTPFDTLQNFVFCKFEKGN